MADLILCSDLHLRDDTPICRTDDYWTIQKQKLKFIFMQAQKHRCPLVIAGDVGHRPQWSNRLMNVFIHTANICQIQIYCVFGQHDMIGNNIERLADTSLSVLINANVIRADSGSFHLQYNTYVKLAPYGQEIEKPSGYPQTKNILVTHKMVIKEPLWPGQEAMTAKGMLKKYPEYDLIVTGDNHQSFTQKYKNRILVNPGSMMRMTTAQEDHEPKIYAYFADENTVEEIPIPIEQGVITRKHLRQKEEKQERMNLLTHEKMQAYVDGVKEDRETGVSFKDNMQTTLKKEKIKKRTKHYINESMEE